MRLALLSLVLPTGLAPRAGPLLPPAHLGHGPQHPLPDPHRGHGGPWGDDAPPGRAKLRAFLEADRAEAHALILVGSRLSASAVAHDIWSLANARGRTLMVVGRPLLRGPAMPQPGLAGAPAASPLPPAELSDRALADPSAVAAQVERVAERAAAVGSRGLTLVTAPGGPAAAHALRLDELLDAMPGASGSGRAVERYCLLHRAELRHRGPSDTLRVLQHHPESLVLA